VTLACVVDWANSVAGSPNVRTKAHRKNDKTRRRNVARLFIAIAPDFDAGWFDRVIDPACE
jgi:hypothetical protein